MFTFVTAVSLSLAALLSAAAQPDESQSPEGTEKLAETKTSQKPLIPRDVLFGNPERISVKLSPDGTKLAYLAPHDGVLNIWVKPIGEGEAQAITQYGDRPLSGFSWSWNNEQILFGRDQNGDENTHVYVVDVDNHMIKDLTPFKDVNARVVERNRKRPDEVLVAINDRDPQYHDYYTINTRTGEQTLVQKNTENHAAYLFDPHWNIRGRVKMTPDGGMMVEGYDEEGWFDFMAISMEDSMTTQPMGFNVAGDKIYALDSRGRNTAALVEMPATRDGANQGNVLYVSEKADVGGVMMHPTTREPQAVMVNYLHQDWNPLDSELEKDLSALAKLDEGDFDITSRTADDRTWTISYMQDAGPVRYWLWDRDAQEGTYLFSHRPDLEKYELLTMESIEIPTRDGMTMPSYLTRPAGATSATPMVLLVHGGPWGRDAWGYNPMHQWLADRGYAVLSPNFRGSTGFGKDFINAGNLEWYGKMQDDLVDATEWAIENNIAQKDRIAIMGGSYGGYATLAGLTRDPELYAAGVDIVGPSHVATLLETIPPYWAPIKKMFEARVGSLDDPEYLDSISPLTYVDQIQRPLLIVQGANDPRVKISESDQIVEAMESQNLPVTYIVFPDEGHGMDRPENMMAFNAITEEFLAKHLGGHAEPIGETIYKSNAQVRSKGDLALAGIPVWESDGTVTTRPERTHVELPNLTPEQAAKVQQALAQLRKFPADQLPNLLGDLERRRETVPEADLAAFDYMIQQIEVMMASEIRKADAEPTP